MEEAFKRYVIWLFTIAYNRNPLVFLAKLRDTDPSELRRKISLQIRGYALSYAQSTGETPEVGTYLEAADEIIQHFKTTLAEKLSKLPT